MADISTALDGAIATARTAVDEYRGSCGSGFDERAYRGASRANSMATIIDRIEWLDVRGLAKTKSSRTFSAILAEITASPEQYSTSPDLATDYQELRVLWLATPMSLPEPWRSERIEAAEKYKREVSGLPLRQPRRPYPRNPEPTPCPQCGGECRTVGLPVDDRDGNQTDIVETVSECQTCGDASQ